MRRGQFLQAMAAALGLPAAARAARPVPELRHLRASNGTRPFAGDTPMLATISPRRGVRERALVRFTLTGAARVRLEALRTDTIRVGRPLGEVVWKTERSLPAGAHLIPWRPPRDLQPRTYILRATVIAGPRRRTYGMHRPRSSPDRADRPRARRRHRARAHELRAGRDGRPHDRHRRAVARSPGLPLRGRRAVRRARPAHERRRGHARGHRRLAAAPRRALAAALPPHR